MKLARNRCGKDTQIVPCLSNITVFNFIPLPFTFNPLSQHISNLRSGICFCGSTHTFDSLCALNGYQLLTPSIFPLTVLHSSEFVKRCTLTVLSYIIHSPLLTEAYFCLMIMINCSSITHVLYQYLFFVYTSSLTIIALFFFFLFFQLPPKFGAPFISVPFCIIL